LKELHRPARPLVVGLVDGDDRRLVGGTDHLGNLRITGHQPFTAIHNEHKEIRLLDRPAPAVEHERM